MDIDYSVYFPLSDYYEKVLIPVNSKFKVVKGDKRICCVHDDNDPSLGAIKKKGYEIYHCFGCNFWGNIIDLHKRVSYKYFKKVLTDDEAKRDLCRIFNVNYNTLPKEEVDDLNSIADKDIRKEVAMRRAMEKFDIGDFDRGIIEGKIEGRGIAYFNTLLVRVIAEGVEEDE